MLHLVLCILFAFHQASRVNGHFQAIANLQYCIVVIQNGKWACRWCTVVLPLFFTCEPSSSNQHAAVFFCSFDIRLGVANELICLRPSSRTRSEFCTSPSRMPCKRSKISPCCSTCQLLTKARTWKASIFDSRPIVPAFPTGCSVWGNPLLRPFQFRAKSPI